MNIPLVNLARQYTAIKKDADRAIGEICKKGDFILGDAVREFEQAFASYIHVPYCVGVANGTDAIKLMIEATDITRGDEIIVQVNTFIASVLPIIELGATPVFVDCDETGRIDPDAVARAVTKKTKAILAVHLFGRPAPMKALSTIARRHSLILMEDAAQAHGSALAGVKAGAFGDIAAFSFYPGKNLGAFGDGGAIVTKKERFARTIRILRNIGQKKKYDHVRLGVNSRLDTIQAAVLTVKLKHLDAWNRKRNDIARIFLRELAGVGDIMLPTASAKDEIQNYHLFVIRTAKRDKLARYLNAQGIHTGIHYPVPLHLTPALGFLGYKTGDFPVAEMRAKTMLTLPIYAELTDREISFIVRTMKRFFAA